MTPKDAAANIKETLLNAGFPDAAFEAEQLTCGVLKLSAASMHLSEEKLSGGQIEALENAISKRLSHQPLQYILGEWEFYGLPFSVGEGVLIPRPDTETLVDAALQFIGDREGLKIADLCAGSGCVGIAVEKHTESCSVFSYEKYPAAFRYLKANIKRNNSKANPVLRDIEDGPLSDERFDLLVSNPPYIKAEVMRSLQPEVQFEPDTALSGGTDGLHFYREILKKWLSALNVGGAVAFEIGYDQADEVTALMKAAGLQNIQGICDLSGTQRVIIGTFLPQSNGSKAAALENSIKSS